MPGPGWSLEQRLQLRRQARRAAGHGSGCWAGRSRRRSARPRGCRAGPGCRPACACRRSRSAPAAAHRDAGRAGAAAGDSRAGSHGPIRRRNAPRRSRTGRCRLPAAAARNPRSSPARARHRAGRAGHRAAHRGSRAGPRWRWSARRREMPKPSALRTWSCISAISGEMTIAGPVPRQRRQLVAQRLARPGRHHRQRVQPADGALDHLPPARRENGKSRNGRGEVDARSVTVAPIDAHWSSRKLAQ